MTNPASNDEKTQIDSDMADQTMQDDGTDSPAEVEQTLLEEDGDNSSQQNGNEDKTLIDESLVKNPDANDDQTLIEQDGNSKTDVEDASGNPATDGTLIDEEIKPLESLGQQLESVRVEPTLIDQAKDVDVTQLDGNDVTLLVEGNASAREDFEIDQTILESEGANVDATVIEASQADGTRQDFGGVDVTLDGDGDRAADDDATMAGGQAANPYATTVDQINVDVSETLEGAGKADIGTAKKYLSHFLLERELGEGAFGKVYLGYDERLDRYVALKVAKSGMLIDKSDVNRFLREARAAAKLRHQNIVPLYEVGTVGPTNFIAYDFVKGITLKQKLLEAGRLSQTDAVRICRKIALALDYAHEQGIVHRDIKPENVLVDEKEEPHILDFGLARSDEGDTTKTREGAMMGSPAYMSPEQAKGQSHIADGRADLWSVGIILYELIAGQRPFTGNVTEVLIGVREKEAASVTTIVEDVSKDLDTIINKCLSKDPAERYQTGKELAEEFDRWERGEPILARPIGIVPRTWRWAKRNPQVASLLLAVAITLLVGTTVSTVFGIQANRQRNFALEQQTKRAISQVNSLTISQPESVDFILETLQPYNSDVVPHLRERNATQKMTERERGRLLIGLIHLDAELEQSERTQLASKILDYAFEQPISEFKMVCQQITSYAEKLAPELWKMLRDSELSNDKRLKAAAALAVFEPDSDSWSLATFDVVGMLLASDSLQLPQWIEVLRPIRGKLRDALKDKFSFAELERERINAANTLEALFGDDGQLMTDLILQAEVVQFPSIATVLPPHKKTATSILKDELSRPIDEGLGEQAIQRIYQRKANAACALLVLEETGPTFDVLKFSPNHELRTHIIHRIGPCAVPNAFLFEALAKEKDPGVLSALVLAAGEYSIEVFVDSQRRKFIPLVTKLYETNPHPAVHSAAEWLMKHWKDFDIQLADAQKRIPLVQTLEEVPIAESPTWYRTPTGLTMTVLPGPTEFRMGSPESESGSLSFEEVPHQRLIDRTIAVSTTEVTLELFREFIDEKKDQFDKTSNPYKFYQNTSAEIETYSPSQQCPMNLTSWLDAISFCRWLSEREGIPESEMCYPPIKEITTRVQLPKDLLNRKGYRLLTAAEWEMTARAGTQTIRHYGINEEFLNEYCWYQKDSEGHMWPVGRLKPNGFGLFDTIGNAEEWTQSNWVDDYPVSPDGTPVRDELAGALDTLKELRGGNFDSTLRFIRTAARVDNFQITRDVRYGFRVARTIRSHSNGSSSE